VLLYRPNKCQKSLEKRFEAQALFEASLLPSGKQSGFSHPKLPIITQAKPGLIQLISWGLIPAWATAEQASTLPNQTLNAKSETIFEKASFEPSVLRQRCLVLVDGFFEWQTRGKEKSNIESNSAPLVPSHLRAFMRFGWIL